MSIGSQEEEDNVLWQIIPQSYMYKSFWIGLKRKIDANGEEYPADYEWVDGEQTDYQHFKGKRDYLYFKLVSTLLNQVSCLMFNSIFYFYII